jgi:hypothetical protein
LSGPDWPKRTARDWKFIYKSWVSQSYLWQGFGVLWLIWGGGLTGWMFATQDTSKMTGWGIAILVLATVVPSSGLVFGAWRFRRWALKRQALSPEPPADYPLNVIRGSLDKTETR